MSDQRELMRVGWVLVAATLAVCVAVAAARAQPGKDCSRQSTGLTPISDLGSGTYMGFEGGLYAGGSNVRPEALRRAGVLMGRAVKPLGPDGVPTPSGRIVVLTVGMSNTSRESKALVEGYEAFPNASQRVLIVNGAVGGQDAAAVSDPGAWYWDVVDARLAQAGVTREQVQVVWLKEAIAGQDKPFPADALELAGHLSAIVGILAERFPNLKQCYLSSRIYGGYALGPLSPEPWAYQSAFAVKWVIEGQRAGDPSLTLDPAGGAAARPWLGWAAYLWADGLSGRSDGLVWSCEDFAADGTHPSQGGAGKVAAMLIDGWGRDPAARPWFVRCQADLDNDGSVTVFDYVAFAGAFAGGDPLADCDGSGTLDTFDFMCFANLVNAGCS